MKTKNGWTKKSMIDHIQKNFTGKSINTEFRGTFQGLTCMYRSQQGRKCAVGIFIPDELYSMSMEGGSVQGVCQSHPGVEKHLPLDRWGMTSLQRTHDDSRPESTLQDMLAWIEMNVEGEA